MTETTFDRLHTYFLYRRQPASHFLLSLIVEEEWIFLLHLHDRNNLLSTAYILTIYVDSLAFFENYLFALWFHHVVRNSRKKLQRSSLKIRSCSTIVEMILLTKIVFTYIQSKPNHKNFPLKSLHLYLFHKISFCEVILLIL